MASRINGVGKLLTESDGVQQPKTQPVDGSMHRLIEGGGDKRLQTGQDFDPEPSHEDNLTFSNSGVALQTGKCVYLKHQTALQLLNSMK